MLETEEHCDLVIDCQGQAFKVHSLVLMASGSSILTGKEQGVSEIALDEDPKSFRRLLDFIYKGQVVDTGLGVLAEKYGLLDSWKLAVKDLQQRKAIDVTRLGLS